MKRSVKDTPSGSHLALGGSWRVESRGPTQLAGRLHESLLEVGQKEQPVTHLPGIKTLHRSTEQLSDRPLQTPIS